MAPIDGLDLTVVSHAQQSAQFKLSRNNPLEVGDLALAVSEDCKDVGLMQMTGPYRVAPTSSLSTMLAVRYLQGIVPRQCAGPSPLPVMMIILPPVAWLMVLGAFLMRFAAIGYFIGNSGADDYPAGALSGSVQWQSDGDVAVARTK